MKEPELQNHKVIKELDMTEPLTLLPYHRYFILFSSVSAVL